MIDEVSRRMRGGASCGPLVSGHPDFHQGLTFHEDRMEFGAGDVAAQLVEMRGGGFRLYFDGGRERARLRLACAFLRPIGDDDFDALFSAASDWRNGDRPLAYIKLCLTRLWRFERPETLGKRMLFADVEMRRSSPRAVLKALGLEEENFIGKYDPDEPRVPAGSGARSGRWTNGDAGGNARAPRFQTASATTAAGAIRAAGTEATAGVAWEQFSLAVEAGLAAPIAAAAVGLLFSGTQAGGVSTDYVNGLPGVLYRWDRASGQLQVLSDTSLDASPILAYRQGSDGFYRDADGNALARATTGGLVLDPAGVLHALQGVHGESSERDDARSISQTHSDADEEPKICPDDSADVPHGASKDAIAYQAGVSGLPPGLAIRFHGEVYDGCGLISGDMVEAKSRYAQFINKNTNKWQGWYKGWESDLEQFERLATAAGPREFQIHFKQKPVADLFADAIREFDDKDNPNIFQHTRVIWNPEGKRAQ